MSWKSNGPLILNTLNIPPGQSLMCVRIHQIVARMCGQYLAELSRYNYVTPKSYLDLLSIFSSLIGWKKQELHGARLRMKTGLDKVKKKKENRNTVFVFCHSLVMHTSHLWKWVQTIFSDTCFSEWKRMTCIVFGCRFCFDVYQDFFSFFLLSFNLKVSMSHNYSAIKGRP